MARQPVRKPEKESKIQVVMSGTDPQTGEKVEIDMAAPKPARVKCFILFSQDQAIALINHLSHARGKLNDREQRDFDNGPLGQVLRNLRG